MLTEVDEEICRELSFLVALSEGSCQLFILIEATYPHVNKALCLKKTSKNGGGGGGGGGGEAQKTVLNFRGEESPCFVFKHIDKNYP